MQIKDYSREFLITMYNISFSFYI